MNRYESVLLDRMVSLERSRREIIEANAVGEYADDFKRAVEDILLLLDCICDFREPPRELAVEEVCGVLVDAKGEVVA